MYKNLYINENINFILYKYYIVCIKITILLIFIRNLYYLILFIYFFNINKLNFK